MQYQQGLFLPVRPLPDIEFLKCGLIEIPETAGQRGVTDRLSCRLVAKIVRLQPMFVNQRVSRPAAAAAKLLRRLRVDHPGRNVCSAVLADGRWV
jgi:hypothetical protein